MESNPRKGFLSFLTITPFCLILSTVLVVSNQLADGITSGKYFWFYASMGLMSINMVVSCFLCRKKIQFTIDDGLISLFCLSGLIVTAINSGIFTTKWILLLLIWALYIYLRIGLIQQKKLLPLLMFFLILTGLIEAVWGLLQLYGLSPLYHPIFVTTGSFFNSGPYSGYLAVLFPIALYNFINHQKQTNDQKSVPNDLRLSTLTYYISIITCLAIILVLPAAKSRASWLAAIAGSLFVVFDYLSRRFSLRQLYSKHMKKVLFAVVACFIISGVALYGIYNLKKDSADGRAFIWKITLKAIQKNPMGVGLNHFSGIYGEEQEHYFAAGQVSEKEEFIAGSPEYGFNDYLQLCLEWGVLPFLLFLLIIARGFYNGYKRRKIATLSSLTALIVFAGVSYPFSVLPFLILTSFLFADIHSDDENNSAKKGISTIIPAIGCLILSSFCLYNRYPVFNAYKNWKIGKRAYNTEQFEKAAQDYELLYPYLNDQFLFLFEYGRSLALSKQQGMSNDILKEATRISCDPMLYNMIGKNYQAMKEYELAEGSLRKSLLIVPNRIYPYYLLMKLYAESGNSEKALEAATIVLTKEPKVQSQAISEMREEAMKIINYLK